MSNINKVRIKGKEYQIGGKNYIAGENIKIEGNVISATGGGSETLYSHVLTLIGNTTNVEFGGLTNPTFTSVPIITKSSTPITREDFFNYLNSLTSNGTVLHFKSAMHYSWGYYNAGGIRVIVTYTGITSTNEISSVQKTMTLADLNNFFSEENVGGNKTVTDKVTEITYEFPQQII